MTDEYTKELIKGLKEKTKEVAASKEAALEFLQEAGILDENGDFTEPYKNLGEFCTAGTQD